MTFIGLHSSQKVINALILLNYDECGFNEQHASGETVTEMLRINSRKVERVKQQFVEKGLDICQWPYEIDFSVVCMDKFPRQSTGKSRLELAPVRVP